MVRVQVNEGILEGVVVNNDYGGTFCSFKGIPYAEPPLGDLRFKAPKPPKPWDGIRSAKAFGPMCYQYDLFLGNSAQGSEDCLYLNVYTPDLNPPKPLPVMFWIHGGGFTAGSSDDTIFSPEYLVKHGVILVTCNYRLEILGFLCLDTEDVPGNAGMKDQVAALRWVNKNIKNFGGDPNNVTIFGESAGGGCVGYHLMSPMTKGLFKRAIAQSGAATCWWTYQTEPKERALILARQLGFHSGSDKDLYEFLKSQPVEALINIKAPINLLEREKVTYEAQFVVVSEKKFGDNERFFYGDYSFKNLVENIHEGVEVYTGFTKDEGLITLSIGGTLKNKLEQMNKLYDDFIPKPIAYNCSASQSLDAGKKIKEFYFGKKDIEVDDWEQMVKFHSVEFFLYGAIQLAKTIARVNKNKIYLYQFSCLSERNQFANFLGLGELVKGRQFACHGDDVLYLFNAKILPKVDKNSDTYKLIDRVTTIWTNIAKYGNPTPDNSLGVKWSPYTLEKQEYLDIGNELSLGTAPYEVEIQHWERIFRKYTPGYVYDNK